MMEGNWSTMAFVLDKMQAAQITFFFFLNLLTGFIYKGVCWLLASQVCVIPTREGVCVRMNVI